MFVYEKKLQYPVKIKNTNPRLAALIISQYGGPDGELGASLRYLSQRFSMPYPELKGLLTDIGTEELGHLEMIGAIVHQLTCNLSEQDIKTAGFDAYFVSDDVSFSVKTENASDLEYQGYEIAGLKDYAKEICSLNGISTDKLVQRNNYYYFSNTQTVSGAKYTYLHCMLKEGNNYWICEFVCKHRSYESLEKSMLQWADSITFDQQ